MELKPLPLFRCGSYYKRSFYIFAVKKARRMAFLARNFATDFIFFLIGVQLLYTALSVSAVQPSESAICIRTSPLLLIPFPQNTTKHREFWCQSVLIILSILYTVVYIGQSQFLNSSHHHSFALWYPHDYSLYLCLYFCFISKIITTTFLDSTYMHQHNTYFSLSDLVHSI